jgi:uncharacterized membrane protein YbhN (UPF0104 family)
MKKPLRVVLLFLLSLAVIGGLLWFGDIKTVGKLIEHFQRIYFLWFLLLMVAHEALRAALWVYLLRALCIDAPLRTAVFAFAAGEAAKFLPTGAYFQNYLLQRSRDVDFGRSSAATTYIILSEIVAALALLAIIGLGPWSIWLRPLILAGVPLLALMAWGLAQLHAHPRTPRWVKEHRILCKALVEFRRFRQAAAALLHPRIVGITLLLSSAYVITAGATLYIVFPAIGIGGVSFGQALAAYCFGLAFYLILGSLEAASVAAFIVVGASKSAAVTAIVINRGLTLGGTLVMALVAMAVLYDEFRAVLWPEEAKSPQRALASQTAETANPVESRWER